jgi:hypothetical protein
MLIFRYFFCAAATQAQTEIDEYFSGDRPKTAQVKGKIAELDKRMEQA